MTSFILRGYHNELKFHSTCIDKVYKDDDQWKHTTSYAAEDLPKVALVANEVYKYLRVRVSDSEAVEHE